MLLQTEKADLIIYMINDFETHEARSNCTPIKKLKSTISTKIKIGIPRLFYPFCISSAKYS